MDLELRQDLKTTHHLTVRAVINLRSEIVSKCPDLQYFPHQGFYSISWFVFILSRHILLLKVNFLLYTSVHITIYLSSLCSFFSSLC